MSRRYPSTITCPHCGLSVAANGQRMRPHAGQAKRAGLADVPCLRDEATAPLAAPPKVAVEDYDSRLPAHLRESE